jgi:hypothetical protein
MELAVWIPGFYGSRKGNDTKKALRVLPFTGQRELEFLEGWKIIGQSFADGHDQSPLSPSPPAPLPPGARGELRRL